MKLGQLVLSLLLPCALIGNIVAQEVVKPLQIGDQVPDLEFTNLVNTDKKIIRLSDYKGKLIILDFFATWCAPCVKALPHLDSLQTEFKDELVILPITSERNEKVMDFLSKQPEYKLSLPYVYQTSLQDYFPFRLLPLEVWIDGTGKVIGLTDGEAVTADNIKKVLAEKSAKLPEKQDVLDRDETKPFMAGFFGSYKFQPEQLLYSSILTRGFEGMPGMSTNGPWTKDGMSRLAVSNNYVIKLYWTALLDVIGSFGKDTNPEFYSKKEFYKKMLSRMIWEAKDSSLCWSKETTPIISKKPYREVVFNYELLMPETDNANFKRIMRNDLNRYFGELYGIEGLLEKRKVKCYALTVVGPDNLFKSKGGEKDFGLEPGVKRFKISNYRIDDIMFWWIDFHIPYFDFPIINETDYDGPVDFDLGEIDTEDFHAVNKALKKFGLEFKLVERELDMVVIRDVKKP